ncbi:putative glycosyltransferase EpsE [mine drainage metagenome]|uniref:Putative glycosyltransferase EpsE n=1 Tax=mine drainage metagenome TaxID=410659 RepID=A0A1J5S6N6_9ZZZZ
MPVYNAGKYLRLAVLSIVRQTFTDWELLIVDDGSTDNALQGIADIDDARIRILRDGKNKGLAARLNECIDLARGKYFARMDQDDVSYPERFEQQIEALQKDSALDLVAVRAITIDENSKVTGVFPSAPAHDEICARPWRGFHFPHPTWMGKIEWFRKYRYAEPGPYFCEDQELLLRSHGRSRFATVDEILFAYRVRGKMNWPKLAKTRWAVLKVQMRHFSRLSQWHFASLALAAYIVKMAGDLSKRLRAKNIQYESANVDDAVGSRWHEICDGIAKELKAP